MTTTTGDGAAPRSSGWSRSARLDCRVREEEEQQGTLSDKLRNVPAFFVAISRGSPYLINKEQEGAQECVIFLEPGDAEQLLKEMVQASPMLADARVMCVGLDRASHARAARDADGQRAQGPPAHVKGIGCSRRSASSGPRGRSSPSR